MPTLADLYNIRTPMEAALKTYLDAATGATGYPTQGTANRTCPFYEIDFEQGNSTGHLQPAPDGNCYEDAWNGSLRIVFTSERSNSGQPAEHVGAVGAIKAALARQNPFTADALPLHELLSCRLQSSPFRCDSQNNVDETELSFSVTSCIRADVWVQVFASAIKTESGNTLTTESGDTLVLESFTS